MEGALLEVRAQQAEKLEPISLSHVCSGLRLGNMSQGSTRHKRHQVYKSMNKKQLDRADGQYTDSPKSEAEKYLGVFFTRAISER